MFGRNLYVLFIKVLRSFTFYEDWHVLMINPEPLLPPGTFSSLPVVDVAFEETESDVVAPVNDGPEGR